MAGIALDDANDRRPVGGENRLGGERRFGQKQ
jgi:hypothetical protein